MRQGPNRSVQMRFELFHSSDSYFKAHVYRTRLFSAVIMK